VLGYVNTRKSAGADPVLDEITADSARGRIGHQENFF
jgi:hypothetical protein